ncbi:hypothetical protein Bbelb_438980 [Branchiostoma belcheri]|nr:hypothetical protein Bbelb_438980 [Branchiostoma belcheri]
MAGQLSRCPARYYMSLGAAAPGPEFGSSGAPGREWKQSCLKHKHGDVPTATLSSLQSPRPAVRVVMKLIPYMTDRRCRFCIGNKSCHVTASPDASGNRSVSGETGDRRDDHTPHRRDIPPATRVVTERAERSPRARVAPPPPGQPTTPR